MKEIALLRGTLFNKKHLYLQILFYFLHHIWKSKVCVWINLTTWNPIFLAEERKPRRNKLKRQLHLLPNVYIKIFCYYKYKIHILVNELKTRRIVGRAPLIFSSTLDGGEWSASCPGRFSLWAPINKETEWVPILFGRFWDTEQSVVPTGIEPRFLGFPAHNLISISNTLSLLL
jgi:hypothetical protein